MMEPPISTAVHHHYNTSQLYSICKSVAAFVPCMSCNNALSALILKVTVIHKTVLTYGRTTTCRIFVLSTEQHSRDG